jgi:hypothetical protein
VRLVSPAKAGAQFLLLLLLASCAARPPSPEAFTFAVFGDLAYSEHEEKLYLDTMRRIDAAAPAFAVHVGDFKGGGPCSDALYARRRAEFDASAVPLVYIPGDNEWTDCRSSRMGSMDPIERLARLRTVFFADEWSLGRKRMATAAQATCVDNAPAECGCNAHPENRSWRHQRVLFVTVNIPGHRNNVGHDARNDQEARCRNAANAAWLERAAREAESAEVRALVVLAHANPWEPSKGHADVFNGFLAQMATLPPRLRKPILFAHGDTHTYRVTEFLDPAGQVVGGITRLETYGTPTIGWVRVSVEPGRLNPFTFEPNLVGISLPH